jgi:hypothetical protein
MGRSKDSYNLLELQQLGVYAPWGVENDYRMELYKWFNLYLYLYVYVIIGVDVSALYEPHTIHKHILKIILSFIFIRHIHFIIQSH